MVPVTRISLYDRIRIALAVAGMSMLVACSSAPRTAVEVAPTLQAVRAAPAPPTEAGSASTVDEVEVNPAAPLEAPINDNPGQLLGLDQPALRSLLGKPGFVRRDDPARMWRYRHASCVLDLFLYSAPRESVSLFRVRHVEARSHGLRPASTRTCLRALLGNRGKQPAG